MILTNVELFHSETNRSNNKLCKMCCPIALQRKENSMCQNTVFLNAILNVAVIDGLMQWKQALIEKDFPPTFSWYQAILAIVLSYSKQWSWSQVIAQTAREWEGRSSGGFQIGPLHTKGSVNKATFCQGLCCWWCVEKFINKVKA